MTYTGRWSGSRGTSRRGGWSRRASSAFVSSGRHNPTSEHRTHFGLSTNGSGATARAATPRASATRPWVRPIRSGVSSTRTRCLVAT